MAITSIKHFAEEVSTERLHNYHWRNDRTSGFAFSVDAADQPLRDNPDARANWTKCHDGTYEVVDDGIEVLEHRYTRKPEGRCQCGRSVELGYFTCECDCGRLYNWGGQELAPRADWGEDTGESAADIERGGDDFERDDDY